MEDSVSKEPYVEIVLNGGLGNQLFGWATGYAVSKRTGYKLRVNESDLIGRDCELPKIGIDVEQGIPTNSLSLFFRLPKKLQDLKYMRYFRPRFNYVEESFRFDKRFLAPKPNSTFYGYFQSWKYFDDYSDEIRRTLIDSFPNSTEYTSFKRLLGSQKYIALHVRRGDYLEKISFHGITSKDYYRNALRILANEKTEFSLVCISDSIELAREILPDCDYFLGVNELNDPITILRILSEAEGLIGSNSSLSWWGAYLMADDKLKIFPQRWFAVNSIDTTDLVPKKWKTV